jgi:ubiquinone/menaquinone biosynthesis C-methylase UbiE
MNQDLISYYNERAKEYEKVYLHSAEQNDLQKAEQIFKELFANKTVLEIACGTGWWTERIAETAVSILATDVNDSVIEIAKQKQMPENVTFAVADMFDFEADEKFDSVFAGFIWSHILLQDIDKFLAKVRSFLKSNGTLVLIDGRAVEGTNHDLKNISKTDEFGNTFQTRKLENGTSHLVLKNFPTQDFLHQKLSGFATEINFIDLGYYWITSCKLSQIAE